MTWALNVSSINRNTDSSGRTLCSQTRSLTALNLISFIYTRALENLSFSPSPRSGEEEIEQGLNAELDRLSQAWDGVKEHFGCPVIQNNFELPFFRLMGNMDASDRRGKVNFVTRLNSALHMTG